MQCDQADYLGLTDIMLNFAGPIFSKKKKKKKNVYEQGIVLVAGQTRFKVLGMIITQ